jgi:hypothetical protein
MKITTLNKHTCYCCGLTIKKGEVCFAFMVNPKNPEKNEFDVIYTCSKCVDEETCRVIIKKKGAST